jgi:hypothetical protein
MKERRQRKSPDASMARTIEPVAIITPAVSETNAVVRSSI